MDKMLPRYKKDVPAEEIPAPCEKPELLICQVVDSKLILPRDIRQQFLGCPVWGAEWRSILSQFDRDWGTQIGEEELRTPPTNRARAREETPTPNAPVREQLPVTLPNEPDTMGKLREKYGEVLAELPIPDTAAVLILVSGPALFVAAKEATNLVPSDGPIFTHGAGSWLTGEKASQYESTNPLKGIPCLFVDDQARVVLEDTIQNSGTSI